LRCYNITAEALCQEVFSLTVKKLLALNKMHFNKTAFDSNCKVLNIQTSPSGEQSVNLIKKLLTSRFRKNGEVDPDFLRRKNGPL